MSSDEIVDIFPGDIKESLPLAPPSENIIRFKFFV